MLLCIHILHSSTKHEFLENWTNYSWGENRTFMLAAPIQRVKLDIYSWATLNKSGLFFRLWSGFTLSVSASPRFLFSPVSVWSRDHSGPIRGQYSVSVAACQICIQLQPLWRHCASPGPATHPDTMVPWYPGRSHVAHNGQWLVKIIISQPPPCQFPDGSLPRGYADTPRVPVSDHGHYGVMTSRRNDTPMVPGWPAASVTRSHIWAGETVPAWLSPVSW